MAVVSLTMPPQMRTIRRPSVREQLAGLRADLVAAAGESRDPLSAEELVSAARRVNRIIQRVESGDLA
jgi:hypothetical protein